MTNIYMLCGQNVRSVTPCRVIFFVLNYLLNILYQQIRSK